jgi:RimJ/RimL family protein N-acetyltransferase
VAVLTDVVWPPAPLRTERLVLRQTRAGDRSGYIELLCSDQVRRFLRGAQSRKVVELTAPEVPGAYPGVFAVELRGTFVGAVVVERRDRDRLGHFLDRGNELEVSYTFLPAFWGRGWASEAVGAVLARAWDQLPDEPVLLCTQLANERSLALAMRLGFREVERFSEHGAEQWLGVRRYDGLDGCDRR